MKVLTVGGALIDTIAIVESENIERVSMRNAGASFLMLEEGRKIEASAISTHCGGGAVNAAVAVARLGHDVAALIKLGQDARADVILNRLSEEKISTRYAVRDSRLPTGASVLVSSHDRNAAVFTFRGANTLLEPKDLKPDAFAADLVYVSSLSNQSADCFPAIIDQAKAEGALVAVNPGIRQLSARQGDFQKALAKIDLLLINRLEAEALVPALVAKAGEGGPALPAGEGEAMPALALRGLMGGGFSLSLVAFFGAIRAFGPRWCVVTDGAEGAYAASDGALLYCPAFPAKVVGTAGAGDAFNATLSSFLAEGASMEKALLYGSANASSVVGHADTQTGLRGRKALTARIAEARRSVAVRTWKV